MEKNVHEEYCLKKHETHHKKRFKKRSNEFLFAKKCQKIV